jgi:hypothetical protein
MIITSLYRNEVSSLMKRAASPQLRNRLMVRLCGQQRNFAAQRVGSLAVVWRTDLQQYQLFVWEMRSPLSSLLFTTYEHCYESAIELEQQFDLAGVLRLRPFGSMEAMSEIIQSHQLRERVALAQVRC